MKKYYSRPPSVKTKKLAEAYSGGELVTPFRLFLVLIVSCLMIAGISVSVGKPKVPENINRRGISLVDFPYQFDFNVALKSREENLEVYNRPQHLWSGDKRSALTLEEFWDIYDGKW